MATGAHWPGALAASIGDKPAVIVGETGEILDYAALDAASTRLAARFAAAGCRPGDHVAFLLENGTRFAEACWAAQRSGLHYTPINRQLTAGELAFIVADCEAKVLVCSARRSEMAVSLRAHALAVSSFLAVDGPIEGYDAADGPLPDGGPRAEVLEGAAMLYSSGTTGRPKGIKRPLSGRGPGTSVFGVSAEMAARGGVDADAVLLIPVPLYHSNGVTRLMWTTSVGATAVVMERFDAERALALIERYRVTNVAFVPTMLTRLLRLDPSVRERYDLSSMRRASTGTAPCPRAVKDAISQWWGPILYEVYGGTEGIGQTTISPLEARTRPGSVGRPTLGDVHIVRPDGSDAEAGEIGLVYFSGGRPFEYHNSPEQTASADDDRGRATLGDVGYVDDDGYLYLTDRAADVIISGGVNIYPKEVEEVLATHPDVDDVAVIGVPNEEFGEEVKAVVALVPGASADGLSERLVAHCRASLASFKCPRSVDVVDRLPRLETGKLLRRHVRNPYWEGRESRLV